ncbi:MAG: helicase-related protein [Thermodesulfobacteriota bacterium]|nr:helicase-related protein [Thermodesulfobacteriota bacterium]
MRDPKEAERQHETADEILRRFFDSRSSQRREVQILADEVGMGKTYVGLAVAYSILEHMFWQGKDHDLRGCYQKVLVVTPNNFALFSKWQREISEFVQRCVLPEYRKQVNDWFAPVSVERIDDLSAELRRPGYRSRMIVAKMSTFYGGKLLNYDIKRRFLLGALFAFWSNRFGIDRRWRLMKAAQKEHRLWPENPDELCDLTPWETEQVPFSKRQIKRVLKEIEYGGNEKAFNHLYKVLEISEELSEKYLRHKKEKLRALENRLDKLYRSVTSELIKSSFPLVIVDEAHNWKNHKNGYEQFARIIGRRTRRLLLLTATPFQLHPEEMLKVLEVSDHMAPCPGQEASRERVWRLRQFREEVIRPVLKKAAGASKRFTEAWTRLPRTVTAEGLASAWEAKSFEKARKELVAIAEEPGMATEIKIQDVVRRALDGVDPDIRQMMREALRLFTYNTDLSFEMGELVIRHRRRVEHRMVKVGFEYSQVASGMSTRPDRHLLHASQGIDVQGTGELPHYLLMRCVSEMKNFKGRSSLGNALTGCYSTLLESKEGKDVKRFLEKLPLGKVYLDLLVDMVNERHDRKHPKVSAVVESVIRAWEAGEKSLIFCFRVNTAKRLRDIIDREIRKKLTRQRNRCLGGEDKLKTLRGRLTARERDLVVIGLDRVLWSLIWANGDGSSELEGIRPEDLYLDDNDLLEMARLALSFDVDLTGERVDRVFLNRATEHIVATRLLSKNRSWDHLGEVLQEMAGVEWVSHPYGLDPSDDGIDQGEERSDFDERGVHYRYQMMSEPEERRVRELAEHLATRRARAKKQKQIPILDVYAEGPSLWLGQDPFLAMRKTQTKKNSGLEDVIRKIHGDLRDLTNGEEGFDWESRRLIFQAMRRALLRESVLLRLLPTKTNREESGWGELIVQSFFAPLPRQNESMADRMAVFLEDIKASSGSVSDKNSARYFLFDAVRLRDQQFVALVYGDTGKQVRERIFAGFNTPLLPEVLICTTVGQEGIDLHRHCRNVVHYDLAWNPAVIEQRTGRIDRIGSKTFRERDLSLGAVKLFLEVGLPFLAGTYDERMYEELRIRAQTFEVLTGGDLATDSVEGRDDLDGAEGKERGVDYVPLPTQMMKDIRVKLHVWDGTSSGPL